MITNLSKNEHKTFTGKESYSLIKNGRKMLYIKTITIK